MFRAPAKEPPMFRAAAKAAVKQAPNPSSPARCVSASPRVRRRPAPQCCGCAKTRARYATPKHLAGFDAAPTPGARLHRLWCFFATRQLRHNARLDAHYLRAASNRRPRPSDPDWCSSAARAVARAAQEAYALAGELSRRSDVLLSVAPKLRAKRAARVVDLLLSDDCVSAARAAKVTGLSDRASRRLFDRLIALGAVRELSGRPNFRLYGL